MSEIQYDPACVDCRHDAVKDPAGTTWQCPGHVRAERDWLRARLALEWTIEEQYEAACGDRDALARMVETLRQELDCTVSQRDSWHAECEGWRETSANLQERLDQFDAHGMPNVASALDRIAAAESRLARAEEALRKIAAEGVQHTDVCRVYGDRSGCPVHIARAALAPGEKEENRGS